MMSNNTEDRHLFIPHQIQKDLVPENTHPENYKVIPLKDVDSYEVTRPPMYEIYLRMAENLAKRSTCKRLQVGTVITDMALRTTFSVGYNGNCHGFPNECDRDEPGNCGDIHSECNAIIKAPGLEEKVVFVTDSPCVLCAKMMVQSNVKYVYYRRKYRLPLGLEILEQAGIPAIHYTKWENEWR